MTLAVWAILMRSPPPTPQLLFPSPLSWHYERLSTAGTPVSLFVRSLMVGLGSRCVERVLGLCCPDDTGGKVCLIVQQGLNEACRGGWCVERDWGGWEGGTAEWGKTLGKKYSKIIGWEAVRGKWRAKCFAKWSWRGPGWCWRAKKGERREDRLRVEEEWEADQSVSRGGQMRPEWICDTEKKS